MVSLRNVLVVAVLAGVLLGGGLLVFGGGNGGGSTPATPNTTATPTETTPTTTATTPTQTSNLPPGTGQDGGVTNPKQLLQAHTTALQNASSYTIEVVQRSDGLTNGQRVIVAGAGGPVLYDHFGTAALHEDIWSGQSGVYHRRTLDTQNTTLVHYYVTQRAPSRAQYTTPANVERVLTGTDLTYSGTVTVDGQQAYKFTGNSITNQTALQNAFGSPVSEINTTVLVTKQNVIRSVNATATVNTETGTATRKFSYTATNVGATTLEEPSWLPDAKQKALQFDSQLSGNVVELTVTSGSIDNSSKVRASDGETAFRGTLPFSAEQGDTFYVYVQNGTLQFSQSQPTNAQPDDIPGLRIMFRDDNGLFLADIIVNS